MGYLLFRIPVLKEAGSRPLRNAGLLGWRGGAKAAGIALAAEGRLRAGSREARQPVALRGLWGSRRQQWRASRAGPRAASQMARLSAPGARRQAPPDEVGIEARSPRRLRGCSPNRPRVPRRAPSSRGGPGGSPSLEAWRLCKLLPGSPRASRVQRRLGSGVAATLVSLSDLWNPSF